MLRGYTSGYLSGKVEPETIKLNYRTMRARFVLNHPNDGFDPRIVYPTEKEVLDYLDHKKNGWEDFGFAIDPAVITLGFFGFPTYRLYGAEEMSFKIFLHNLTGWRSDVSNTKAKLNLLLAPLRTAFNIVFALGHTIVNIARLVTEDLPDLIQDLCKFGVAKLDKRLNKSNNSFSEGAMRFVSFCLHVIGWSAKIWRFLGGALTSPFENAKKAYRDTVESYTDSGKREPTNGAKLVGLLMAGFSGLMSIGMYTLFAAATGFVATLPMVKVAAAKIATWLGPQVSSAAIWIANSVLLPIGNTAATPLLKVLPSMLSFGFVETVAAGFGVIRLGLSITKPFRDWVSKKVRQYWEELPPEKTSHYKVFTDETAAVTPKKASSSDSRKTMSTGYTGHRLGVKPDTFRPVVTYDDVDAISEAPSTAPSTIRGSTMYGTTPFLASAYEAPRRGGP